jgi:hypothetical protein
MKTKTVKNGDITKVISFSPIELDDLMISENQKEGTITAQLRQKVTTVSFYPAKKVTSDKQGGLFNVKDFGFEEQTYTSVENRVAWVPVPAAATKEQVIAAIGGKPDSVIYRILSNEPILTKDQQYGIGTGLRTLDFYANQQAVRFPENAETIADGTAGKLTLDNNKVQYRRTFYWEENMEDVDLRGSGKEYISPELQAELAGSADLANQSISTSMSEIVSKETIPA